MEERWLYGGEVALFRRGGSMDQRWLYVGDVALCRRCGSMKERWLYGGEVHWCKISGFSEIAADQTLPVTEFSEIYN